MEQDDENLHREVSRLKYRMRTYSPLHLNSGNLDQHEIKMKERDEVLENLSIATEMFVAKFSSQLGQEKVKEVESQFSTLEEEFLAYRENFTCKVTELKNVSHPVPCLLDSFQIQQNAAKNKVKDKLEAIREDLEKLSKKASKVDDWSAATDLVVERAMKENEKLRKEFDGINTARREVAELMAEFDLDEIRDELSVQECDLKLVDVEKEVEDTVKAVEEQNDIRELYLFIG